MNQVYLIITFNTDNEKQTFACQNNMKQYVAQLMTTLANLAESLRTAPTVEIAEWDTQHIE